MGTSAPRSFGRRRIAGAALVALAIVAGGCDGSGGGSSGSKAVAVAALDFRFDPKIVPVKGGSAVVMTIDNRGKVPHNLTLTEVTGQVDVAPGATAMLRFTAPKRAGTYAFYCRFHKDTQYMVGTLRVTS